jgi:hypothetical protein
MKHKGDKSLGSIGTAEDKGRGDLRLSALGARALATIRVRSSNSIVQKPIISNRMAQFGESKLRRIA